MKINCIKALEVRDHLTLIPVLAVRLEADNPAEQFLFARSGYTNEPTTQKNYVILIKLDGCKAAYSAESWDSTLMQAHLHIQKNFDSLVSGEVVCCEFLRGERAVPKTSERFRD